MKKILVIDDESQILDLFVDFFDDTDIEVLTALDGNIAESLVESHHPDLVITDMLMPNKEGIEIVQQIRESHPNIKIIAMSGMGNSLYLETSKLLGAELTITKPINFTDLKAKVQEMLA
ncbi:MAG: response regulator [Pseudomonadales bacterium]|nr:response regulator [Pseudomonadales bacterium]